MIRLKRIAATLFATGALAGLTAMPAAAQPVVTGGLVNVTITNVANNNTVQIAVPVNAAVAICADVDVNAAVLLAAIADPDVNTFNCDARANQDVTITA
ncbi:MAG: hypothetical protein KY396_02410 [Actinobacteria bacterium]|nr:hypothetical protein [Actinomycetota bacterium]